MNANDSSSIFIPERYDLKYGLFLLNIFLVFGLPVVPGPHWVDRVNDGLSLLFAIPLVYQLPTLFKKTGITISTNGILENLSTYRLNEYTWNHMLRVRFAKVLFMKYVLIDIPEPKQFMEKQSWIHRFTMKNDLRNFGTPVKIPVYTLTKTPEAILTAIYETHQKLMAQSAFDSNPSSQMDPV